MLKLKSEQDKAKNSCEQLRNKHKKRIRAQQLQQIFAPIRRKLIDQMNNCEDPIENIEHIAPPSVQQPLPPNYYEYMSYIMRMYPTQNYPIFHPIASNAPPPKALLPIDEMEENIYFQKNGIIVYKVLLGSGTYAQVWEGKIRATGQKIAAKQVKILQENQRKCLRELQSQHIVRVIDIFTHFSKNFIILEFCDKNLREQLKDCNFKIQMALKYFEQLVYGMDVLQSKNIIHRDLKFENILVKDNTIKIADFGLAKCLGSQLQVESRRCGTPYTMAPQIYFSLSRITSYTTKSDIWSLGVILHEMLYRVHPFDGNSHNFKHEKRVRVIRRFGILDKIIDECLVFNPFVRINWSEFKTYFNYYLQQKHYYSCQKQKPLISKPITTKPKLENFQQREKIQAEKINNPEKPKQKSKSKRKERQQSKDRRQDRTPSRRKKLVYEQKFIDRDKFQHSKQKKAIHKPNLNPSKVGQYNPRQQKKVFEDNIQKKVSLINFKEVQQRPFSNYNKDILQEKAKRQHQLQMKIQRIFGGFAIIAFLIILYSALCVSFD